MISTTFRYPPWLSAVERRAMAAARCAGARSPRRNPSRLNIPVGRLDQRVFWGLSKGNWTLVLPPSSRVARNACAEATIRAVASAAPVCARGDVPCGAERPAATATNTPRQATVPIPKVTRMAPAGTRGTTSPGDPSLMREARSRIRVLLVHPEVRHPEGLVLQQRTLADGNPVQHSAREAAVDAEFAANVRAPDPPHVDVVVLEIDQDPPVADARDLDRIVAIVGVMDLFANLHPFVLEVRQRYVVHDRSLAGARAIDGMEDLDSLVPPRAVGARGDRHTRAPVVGPVLGLELVKVTEVGRGLESGRELEFPFQDLPLVPVALDLRPGRIVGDRLHLIPLAVHGARAATIPIHDGVDVDVEPKGGATRRGFDVNVAVDTVDVPSIASGTVGMLGVVESEPPHIGIDGTVQLAHEGPVRFHGRGAGVSAATRSEDGRPRARPSPFEPGGGVHRRINAIQRELDDVRIRVRKVVELHEILRRNVATRPAFRGLHLLRPVHTIDGGQDDAGDRGALVSTTIQGEDEMAEVLGFRAGLVDGVPPRRAASALRNLKADGVAAGISAPVRGGCHQGPMASIDGEPGHEKKGKEDHA